MRLRAALAATCAAGSIATLAYVVGARLYSGLFEGEQPFAVDRVLLIVIAALLVVLGRLALRLDPRMTLAACAILTSSAASLIVLPALNVNVVDPIRSLLAPLKVALIGVLDPAALPRTIHRVDDRYGYVYIPGLPETERRIGPRVTPTIDADGHRAMPRPEQPRGTVVFLGDSFTFGAGVEDDETYPYVLAVEHWTDLRIVNAGVEGWGLTQFHLALTDMLARPPLPTAVVVTIIADDLRRSHLRPPPMAGLRRRLEWIDGRFVSRDLQDGMDDDDTPELLEQEARLAISTLRAMTEAARAKDVGFAVILLDDGDAFPPDVVYALGRDGVAILDLTRIGQTSLPDGHPDPAGYRTIAAAIASSDLTQLVRGGAFAVKRVIDSR